MGTESRPRRKCAARAYDLSQSTTTATKPTELVIAPANRLAEQHQTENTTESPCYLFKLPPELRLQIFELVIGSKTWHYRRFNDQNYEGEGEAEKLVTRRVTSLLPCTHDPSEQPTDAIDTTHRRCLSSGDAQILMEYSSGPRVHRPCTSLQLVCRQIYRETADLMWLNHEFHFNSGTAFEAFVSRLTRAQRRAVRQIAIMVRIPMEFSREGCHDPRHFETLKWQAPAGAALRSLVGLLRVRIKVDVGAYCFTSNCGNVPWKIMDDDEQRELLEPLAVLSEMPKVRSEVSVRKAWDWQSRLKVIVTEEECLQWEARLKEMVAFKDVDGDAEDTRGEIVGRLRLQGRSSSGRLRRYAVGRAELEYTSLSYTQKCRSLARMVYTPKFGNALGHSARSWLLLDARALGCLLEPVSAGGSALKAQVV